MILYGDTNALHFPLYFFQVGSQPICIPLSGMSIEWKAEATGTSCLFLSIVSLSSLRKLCLMLRGKKRGVSLFKTEEKKLRYL